MAKGEQPRHSLQYWRHRHYGKGTAHHRETQYAPQRADAHTHAKGRYQTEEEHGETLRCHYGKQTEQGDAPYPTGMREVQETEHVQRQQIIDGKEHDSLRQQLCLHGTRETAVGKRYPLVKRTELYLRAQRICRDEEYEKHEAGRHEHRTEIHVVVYPRIAHRMRVECYGLQECHGLLRRHSLCQQRGLSHGSGGKRADRLHFLEDERTGCDGRAAVVERHLGLATGDELLRHVLGEEHETVYLVLLHGMACLVHGRIVRHDVRTLKAVYHASQLSGGRRIVKVHHADRHVHRLSSVHQRSEEHGTEYRHHHHTYPVYGMLQKYLYFTNKKGHLIPGT